MISGTSVTASATLHPLSRCAPHPKTLTLLLDLDAGLQMIWNTG
jgi:hypothetical protein